MSMKAYPLWCGRAIGIALVVSQLTLVGCGSGDLQSMDPSNASQRDAHPVHVSEASFDQEVLSKSGVVVVDFWAPWCGPCKMIAPTLEKLAGEYRGRIKVCKVNTDQNQKLAASYKISGIPALLVFKGGKLIDSKVGAMREDEYRRWFDQLL